MEKKKESMIEKIKPMVYRIMDLQYKMAVAIEKHKPKKKRKVFIINTPSVEGNVFLNKKLNELKQLK